MALIGQGGDPQPGRGGVPGGPVLAVCRSGAQQGVAQDLVTFLAATATSPASTTSRINFFHMAAHPTAGSPASGRGLLLIFHALWRIVHST